MPFAAKLLHLALRGSVGQGPRSKFSSGGAKEECVKKIFGGDREGGDACGFLFNFSTVTENAIITINLFSTSSVMLLSGLKIHHP